MWDSPRSEGIDCDCFSNDREFFVRSFERPKVPKSQILQKVGDQCFHRLTKHQSSSWAPRDNSAPEFADPLHKASLCFFVYLSDSDGNEGELLKIRPMRLTVHLDDESFSLYEPFSPNSGHIQGRMFSRQRVPKESDKEEFFCWKDIHIGEDIRLFGKVYRVVGCDDFTRGQSFLEDRGITVGKFEDMPSDAWNVFRHFRPQRIYRNDPIGFPPVEEDRQSWIPSPQFLHFLVAWLDTENDFHGSKVKRTFRLVGSTEDDTVSLTELTSGFGNSLFLKSSRLPLWNESGRYYRVGNIRPGIWINVFSRPMFVYDCEGPETEAFIRQQFGDWNFGESLRQILQRGPPTEKFETYPQQLVFSASNKEFPNVEFVVFYSVNFRRLDVFESGRRPFTRGRSFLLDVDVSHLGMSAFVVGSSLRLFRWTFRLEASDSSTQTFLRSLEPEDVSPFRSP